MPGSIRSPHIVRPAAILLAAVLLAGCTGGSNRSTDTTAPQQPSASAGSTTTGAPTPTPSKSKPKPRRTPKPTPHQAGPFSFRVAAVGHTLTGGRLKPAEVNRATHRTVKAVHQRFDALFRATYIDADHWRNASYWKAFQTAFAGQVRAVALTRRQKLTLGPDAGKRFESVSEPVGRLSVNVLIGPGGGPVTSLVHATFKEKAARQSSGTSLIVSDGRYYLEPTNHGWVIVAFRVGRHDHGV